MVEAKWLNADAHAARLNGAALQQSLLAQGEAWYELVVERCPHLFADVAVFISPVQLQQMQGVIAAVERVVNNEKWIIENGQLETEHLKPGTENGKLKTGPSGVFYGYDFHLNSDGAHLIEINTNAGGAFLNALLLDSQRDVDLPGVAASEADLERVFIAMFRREWQLQRGDAALTCIAIVDQMPEQQYLYPEFLLAQRLFERAGIHVCIADPAEFKSRDGGLYVGEQQIDLVYNRLTDFTLQQHPVLLHAYLEGSVVLTPNPAHYACYADKRNLARLTDVDELRELGVNDDDIATLQSGIPHTFVVQPDLEVSLWADRKQLFFKPYSGYGSRGAYRGEKLTRRVFGEILQSGYIAQKLAAPGEHRVSDEESLKYDVRCYVYDGKIQLVAARLYQGQTTNFRTPGGGFAPVRVAGQSDAMAGNL
ncbi:MAG: hypothetical protein Q7T38_06420 [Gallionella sp.]|nr:hypothetical protein [Gallionella sp.]